MAASHGTSWAVLRRVESWYRTSESLASVSSLCGMTRLADHMGINAITIPFLDGELR
jgi:hypothetical protein